jgi:hypothetical protein
MNEKKSRSGSKPQGDGIIQSLHECRSGCDVTPKIRSRRAALMGNNTGHVVFSKRQVHVTANPVSSEPTR